MELGFQISIYKLKTCLLLFLTFLGMHYFSSLVRIFFLRMSINFVRFLQIENYIYKDLKIIYNEFMIITY